VHKISIPGLDNQFCELCRKWVARPDEIERLKKELLTAKNQRYKDLSAQIKEAVYLSEHCPANPLTNAKNQSQ
jgi:hypothetical protein